MNHSLAGFLANPSDSIRAVMQRIDRNAKGVAFVVDESEHLLASITDGDLRRAFLSGVTLADPLQRVLELKQASPFPGAISARTGTDPAELLALARKHRIRQLPLVDAENRLESVWTVDDFWPTAETPHAVIMAGGFGKRLGVLTQETPKPMLPVGEKPLLADTLEQLSSAGIQHVHVTTHYLGDRIASHFGDGQEIGLRIDYANESEPLGTAGGLRLIPPSNQTILVVNGDILTRIDYRAMLDFHREHRAELTLAIRTYEMQVPYGVVACEGVHVQHVAEKPKFRVFVSAGIYLLEPSAIDLIPEGKKFDMTELIDALLESNRSVVSFPIVEYWLDIGQANDYEKARSDLARGGLNL